MAIQDWRNWDERDWWVRELALALRRAKFTRICSYGCEPDNLKNAHLEEYVSILNAATSEKSIHEFLAKYPQMLVAELGQACRWVKSHPQFGSEYVPDFLTCRIDSRGARWTLVELQSPDDKLFTKKGRATEQLDEGIRQISQWRRWLEDRGEYARTPRPKGLGFNGIDARAEGLVVIGRESHRVSPAVREELRAFEWTHHIAIRSYDWLAREVATRIEFRSELQPENDCCVECHPLLYLTYPRRKCDHILT